MKKLLITILILLVNQELVFSDMPNRVEWYCLDTIKVLEDILAKKLDEQYFIEKIANSSIGKLLTDQIFVRDIIIKMKDGYKEKVVCIIFPYRMDKYSTIDNVNFKLVFDNSQRTFLVEGIETFEISFCILCPDNILKKRILDIIYQELNIDILKNTYLDNDLNDYERVRNKLEILSI